MLKSWVEEANCLRICLSLVSNALTNIQMKIAIGSDHAGFRYKGIITDYLIGSGHEVIDFGTDSEEPVDYPLFIRPVAVAVAAGEVERGDIARRGGVAPARRH